MATLLALLSLRSEGQITYRFDNFLTCKFRGFVYYYTTTNALVSQTVPNINASTSTTVTLPANADRIYGVRVYPFPSGATDNQFFKCANDYPANLNISDCRTDGCQHGPPQWPCTQPTSHVGKSIVYTGSQAWLGFNGQTIRLCSDHLPKIPSNFIGDSWPGPCCNNRGMKISNNPACP